MSDGRQFWCSKGAQGRCHAAFKKGHFHSCPDLDSGSDNHALCARDMVARELRDVHDATGLRATLQNGLKRLDRSFSPSRDTYMADRARSPSPSSPKAKKTRKDDDDGLLPGERRMQREMEKRLKQEAAEKRKKDAAAKKKELAKKKAADAEAKKAEKAAAKGKGKKAAPKKAAAKNTQSDGPLSEEEQWRQWENEHLANLRQEMRRDADAIRKKYDDRGMRPMVVAQRKAAAAKRQADKRQKENEAIDQMSTAELRETLRKKRDAKRAREEQNR